MKFWKKIATTESKGASWDFCNDTTNKRVTLTFYSDDTETMAHNGQLNISYEQFSELLQFMKKLNSDVAKK